MWSYMGVSHISTLMEYDNILNITFTRKVT